MSYQFVRCPNFIQKDPSTGALVAIQCKLCGSVIADTIERTVGYEKSASGQLIKVVQRQLTRFSNYTEIKIAFEDPGYFHVTHGCAKCLSMNLSVPVLTELHAADQGESPDGFTPREQLQVPTSVLVLRKDQSGIV